MKNVIIYLLAALSVFQSACSQKPAEEPPRSWTLPARAMDGSCDPIPAPSLCTWAASVDAVVWGTLLEVRLADLPLSVYTSALGDWKMISVEECESQSISPALELVLEVKQSHRSGVPRTIRARMGAMEATRFNPMWYRGDDGSLQWANMSAFPDVGPPVPGQPLGLALHWVEEFDAWALMGEPIFSLGEDGKIFVQSRLGSCVEPPPVGLAGLAPGDLATAIGSCQETPESVARHSFVINCYGPAGKRAPDQYLAAQCSWLGNDGQPPGRCASDRDCPPGELCTNGSCQ